MIGVKNIVPALVLFMALGLDGGINCQELPCPICTYTFNETYKAGSLYNIENGGVPFGCTCAVGTVYTLFGRDFGVTQDASCCDVSPPPQTPNSGLTCPPIPKIRPSETVQNYYIRVGKTVKNAPTNGNCPDPNTYQFIFYSEYAESSQDICTCVTVNNYVQKAEICV